MGEKHPPCPWFSKSFSQSFVLTFPYSKHPMEIIGGERPDIQKVS
jgi:hypothetical protein